MQIVHCMIYVASLDYFYRFLYEVWVTFAISIRKIFYLCDVVPR